MNAMNEHTWNHRVTLIDGMLGISEVYYNDLGVIELWSNHVEPMGEDMKELKEEMAMFTRALSQPVLKQVGEDEFARLVEMK